MDISFFIVNDYLFMLARAIVFTLIWMITLVSLIFIEGHRMVFFSLAAWMTAIIGGTIIHETVGGSAYLFYTNTVTTFFEVLFMLSVAIRLGQYLKKSSNGNGKPHEPPKTQGRTG